MKLLVVDHNAIEPTNRVLYQKIVELGGIDLRLIVPSKWFNNFNMIEFVPPTGDLEYELFASNVLFFTRTHRLIYLSLAKHLKEFQPDVFYVNAEPENFQTLQAVLLNSSRRARLVFSSWRNVDHATEGYPYRFSFLHGQIEKFVLTRATHGIVFNDSAKKIFLTNGFSSTTIIPPPIDTELFQPRESRNKRDTFVIGYVGRLVQSKGVDLILRVVESLPAAFSAMIVGEGELKAELKKLASRLGITERVAFIDAVSPPALVDLYAQMDVVVLPSRTTTFWQEQFGRVLVEAMACGVPVIGSNSGEIPRVIADAGLVFKEENVDGLRLGIQRLHANESLRNDLIRRGIERVNKMFSLEVVAAQHHKLFTSL